MFYEAMEEVLPDLELIIDSADGVQKVLPLDSFFSINEVSKDSTGTADRAAENNVTAATEEQGEE